MKSIINITVTILILMNGLGSLYKSEFSSDDRKSSIKEERLDLLEKTSSEFAVIKEGVKEKEVVGHFYRKIQQENGHITSIELFDREGGKMDDLYQSAIAKFSYNTNEKTIEVALFNKNEAATIDPFQGYHKAIFKLDSHDRVIEVNYYDINALHLKPSIVHDQKPAREVYQYQAQGVLLKQFDESGRFIQRVATTTPVIPYMNSVVQLEAQPEHKTSEISSFGKTAAAFSQYYPGCHSSIPAFNVILDNPDTVLNNIKKIELTCIFKILDQAQVSVLHQKDPRAYEFLERCYTAFDGGYSTALAGTLKQLWLSQDTFFLKKVMGSSKEKNLDIIELIQDELEMDLDTDMDFEGRLNKLD
jgi:hypothetical protein